MFIVLSHLDTHTDIAIFSEKVNAFNHSMSMIVEDIQKDEYFNPINAKDILRKIILKDYKEAIDEWNKYQSEIPFSNKNITVTGIDVDVFDIGYENAAKNMLEELEKDVANDNN